MATSNIIYVPVWPVASQLKTNIIWDERKQQVKSEKGAVRGFVKNDILYVTADDLAILFDGQQSFQEETGVFEYYVLSVFVNGRLITHDVQQVDGLLALPALKLAAELGIKVNWDAAKGNFMIVGQKVPVHMIGNQPYIKINNINEFFNAYVYWNEKEHTIELTYPF